MVVWLFRPRIRLRLWIKVGVIDEGGESTMLTGILVVAMVLPAMFLGHMAHEEIQSQRAYRRARVKARIR
jgi:hypothetical protein